MNPPSYPIFLFKYTDFWEDTNKELPHMKKKKKKLNMGSFASNMIKV